MKELPPQMLKLLESFPEMKQEYIDKGLVKDPIDAFITCNVDMILMKDQVKKYRKLSYPVMILGESGTGKEIIARCLHNREGRFVAINCTSLPTTLLESLLFGHVKGAFTGADKDKIGLVEYAENGTLLLDEIGDMPQELQAKLLRVLQNKTFRKVGANEEQATNARIIASTHQSKSKLRNDLWYRLSALTIRITPLRERLMDIIPTAKHIAAKLGIEWNSFIETNVEKERFYEGNVRQLENIVIQSSII